MLQNYSFSACATLSHPIVKAKLLIFNMRYLMAQKNDELRDLP